MDTLRETPIPTIPAAKATITREIRAFGQPVELKVTTRRTFQNAMRKQFGYYLNEPAPCTWGYKGGNWSGVDSDGQSWQVGTGNDYDPYSYLLSLAKEEIWQKIAHSVGFHLEDCRG